MKKIFEKLWKKVNADLKKDNGSRIFYRGRARSQSGYYDNWRGICLIKPQLIRNVNDINFKHYNDEDLFILAHEYGHFLDKDNYLNNKQESGAYITWRNCGMVTARQRELICGCEKRAWRNAKKILKKLGMKNFKMFNQMRKYALSEYATMPVAFEW